MILIIWCLTQRSCSNLFTCCCKLNIGGNILFKVSWGRCVKMCVSDAAALVLTLCCGAGWTSRCSSSRLLLLVSLLKSTSVRCTLQRSPFSFLSIPSTRFLSSETVLLLPSFPCVQLKELSVSFGGFLLKRYLFGGGLASCSSGLLLLLLSTIQSCQWSWLGCRKFSFPHAASNSCVVVTQGCSPLSGRKQFFSQ